MTLLTGRDSDHHRDVLTRALRDLGALRLWHRWGMGGSQEVEVWWYLVGWRLLRIEAETYIGLSAAGPRRLVSHLVRALGQAPPQA